MFKIEHLQNYLCSKFYVLPIFHFNIKLEKNIPRYNRACQLKYNKLFCIKKASSTTNC